MLLRSSIPQTWIEKLPIDWRRLISRYWKMKPMTGRTAMPTITIHLPVPYNTSKMLIKLIILIIHHIKQFKLQISQIKCFPFAGEKKRKKLVNVEFKNIFEDASSCQNYLGHWYPLINTQELLWDQSSAMSISIFSSANGSLSALFPSTSVECYSFATSSDLASISLFTTIKPW